MRFLDLCVNSFKHFWHRSCFVGILSLNGAGMRDIIDIEMFNCGLCLFKNSLEFFYLKKKNTPKAKFK